MAASLRLVVRCASTQWGQVVAVVGSFNDWSASSATTLTTTSDTFPEWRGEILLPVSIPANVDLEYKYIIFSNGAIVRWENGANRRIPAPAPDSSVSQDDGVFGGEHIAGYKHRPKLKDARVEARAKPTASGYRFGDPPPPGVAPSVKIDQLPALEQALVRITGERRSWRQRLQFVRELFNDSTKDELAESTKFDPTDVAALAVVAAYLTFLSSGQIPCADDGGHHRPNHHADAARAIDAALATVAVDGYAPFVARRVYPLLPSYAGQFTASTPLTRIRDIAHRGDIPHDLKQEIKHTLQNKLHRCAGPEDLVTCRNILERVERGGYSDAFVHELRRFYKELQEFFNAAELDDRLRYLQTEHEELRKPAVHLLRIKHEQAKPHDQLVALTDLRRDIARTSVMRPTSQSATKPSSSPDKDDPEALPSAQLQQVRLADIELERYAFPLLASLASAAERADSAASLAAFLCPSLAIAFENIALSGVRPTEAFAIASELRALCSTKPVSRIALRARAAVDRARRFAAAFSAAIATLFGPRVVALAAALGVEARAAAVFAESEIRANVAFQASRIADTAAKICRQTLNLPPWDPLLIGTAIGDVVYVEQMDDIARAKEIQGSVIAVARDANGEEDIPPYVKAVVLGRSMPHLSHLGVRARQAGVVFVCAEDPAAFQGLWTGTRVVYGEVVVDSRQGLVHLREVQREAVSDDQAVSNDAVGKRKKPNVALKDLDLRGKQVVAMKSTKRANASAKADFVARLTKIAQASNALFAVPAAATVTHSAFQTALAEHSAEYAALIEKYDAVAGGEKAAEAADNVRKFIEGSLVVPEAVLVQLQTELQGADRVMVRSSANAEDLEEMSGAGLYDSVPNVSLDDGEALREAVRTVWGSLWTRRAAAGRAAAGVAHKEVSMAALVQRMAPASLSFVAFSQDPVTAASTAEDKAVAVEIAVGMGETLASGAVPGTPYKFRVSRSKLAVDMVAFASFSDALVPGSDNSKGLVSQCVDYAEQAMTTDAAFREALVRRIARIVLCLEESFGTAQDVEGAVTVKADGIDVFVVQARPQIV